MCLLTAEEKSTGVSDWKSNLLRDSVHAFGFYFPAALRASDDALCGIDGVSDRTGRDTAAHDFSWLLTYSCSTASLRSRG